MLWASAAMAAPSIHLFWPQFPEARAQRELTASQTSAQQCKCSDNGSSVTDHLVPTCCGDNLCMHRKFSPSRTSPPCCTRFCHLCSLCRSPGTSWALLIPSACALFVCIYFCLENVWAGGLSRKCSGKATTTDFCSVYTGCATWA